MASIIGFALIDGQRIPFDRSQFAAALKTITDRIDLLRPALSKLARASKLRTPHSHLATEALALRRAADAVYSDLQEFVREIVLYDDRAEDRLERVISTAESVADHAADLYDDVSEHIQ